MAKANFSDGLTASASMRVPFHDVDPANVVWHGRYFKYFEEVRRTLLEELDYSYQSMMDSGYIWPVVDANVRFLRPLELDQRFIVTACIVEWELRLVVEYRIHGEDGTLHTKGRTVQVPVDADSRELVIGSPSVLIERVEKLLAAKKIDD
jgi:acyl-CoA thioester hydrolase